MRFNDGKKAIDTYICVYTRVILSYHYPESEFGLNFLSSSFVEVNCYFAHSVFEL